jgi:hypothetical protein
MVLKWYGLSRYGYEGFVAGEPTPNNEFPRSKNLDNPRGGWYLI